VREREIGGRCRKKREERKCVSVREGERKKERGVGQGWGGERMRLIVSGRGDIEERGDRDIKREMGDRKCVCESVGGRER
jgi:hypothetical protein